MLQGPGLPPPDTVLLPFPWEACFRDLRTPRSETFGQRGTHGDHRGQTHRGRPGSGLLSQHRPGTRGAQPRTARRRP